ncbi:SDR family NAD(P)-dependent oxidoreductase [Conexibacter arvalis]|uniref:3-oxoacyl-[acyl-carrier protein] reductase n=1 Tax=Conexibacter arvalis TaxID=912552 RepID=A0A840IIB7_9ACTN|nr:SDR family oxidoreductase [Conexibacter arvalis]MBB4663951.1 3-oxoacyl-[acyl-carrier protein] reductase [Conexibacter arvalis]
MELGLKGRRCVVTGASRGIGRAVAETLAGEGADVLLVGRGTEALREAAAAVAEAAAPGARAETFAADVTAAEAGEAIVAACVERLGGIDVLVNNAGTSSVVPLERLEEADWEQQWQLNVRGPERLMRAAAPRMADGGWGRIVNVTSSSGKRPSATNVAYAVTKTAQLALSRAYAEAWAPRGVLVNAVAPGPTASELWMGEGGLADQAAAVRGVDREQVLEAASARVPLGRYSTPGEIADAIAYLCSERAANVVGAAWSVDGGAVPYFI